MKLFYQIFFLSLTTGVCAQNQLWKDYFSYNNVKSLAATPSMTYYATDNSVVSHNDSSGEKKIYNTVNGLKIDDIQTIAYSGAHNKIIVGNAKGNIAIINLNNDNIHYLNDIANKISLTESEKYINKILVNGAFAYVATGYGISEIRLEDNHFGDSFYPGENGINRNIIDLAVKDQTLYAIIENEGIKKGNLQDNLIHYSQWELVNSDAWINIEFINNVLTAYGNDRLYSLENSTPTEIITLGDNLREITQFNGAITFAFRDRILVSDLSYNVFFSYEQNEQLKNFSTGLHKGNYVYGGSYEDGLHEIEDEIKISPNGPYSNNTFRVRNSYNNELWAIYGGHDYNFNPYVGGIKKLPFSVFKNNSWTSVPYKDHKINATSDVSFHPKNKNIAFLSSYLDGLVKVDQLNLAPTDYSFTLYNQENSNISYVELDNSVRTLGVAFDESGNGWITSSLANSNPLAKFDVNMNVSTYSLGTSSNIYLKPSVDKNGTKWIPTIYDGLIGFNERINKLLYFNTGNSSLTSPVINCVTLDRNNQLWVGTKNGLRIVPNVNQFMSSNNVNLTNIVILNEGVAEELFYQQNILDIYVDGSNNKWVSIADAGVFYISSNGQETLFKFDTSNSPLPSNNIHTISMNESTGEVFFGTNKGIVSFTSATSTVAKNDLENVYVFPNPVRPEFQGEVKISDLMEGAIVKITDTSGYLVYETTSLGGTVTWNTYNYNGNKVPSGVYLVFVTSKDGMEKTSRKLMIIR